jgi:hypothetical protein
LNKAQAKIAYRFCYLLGGLLILTPLFFNEYDYLVEFVSDIRFPIGIVLIGAGLFIKKGIKDEQK